MIKKICSVMLLCATILMASCQKDDEATIGVSEVKLDKTELSLVVNTGGTLVATILPDNAEDATVTWSSSDKTVATVSEAGVVSAIKVGETTITATAGGKTATCKVTVEEKPSITWAAGNLVADAVNGGCKVGTATDGGLFFQFGSLVGWSTEDPLEVAVSPVGYTGGTSWNSSWTGDSEISATDDAVSGKGDPCRYYLKDTWRLPTKDEYVALFKDGGYPNGTWKWENSSATNATLGLTFPASGYRLDDDGSLGIVGANGSYWSASPDNASYAYNLDFGSSYVLPSANYSRALGFPVRCVQNASN